MCEMIRAFCGLSLGPMLVVFVIGGAAIAGVFLLAYRLGWKRGHQVGSQHATEQAEKRAVLVTRKNVAGRITNVLNGRLGPLVVARRAEYADCSMIRIFKGRHAEPFYEAEVSVAGDKVSVLYSGQREELLVDGPNDPLLDFWIQKFGDVLVSELRA